MSGWPLTPTPGSNIFLSDVDSSTELLPDGSRLVTCHQISDFQGLRDAWQGLRWLSRFVL